MNMYLSLKTAVQDDWEYQDFLKMFTGKGKTRETGEHIATIKYLYDQNEKKLILHLIPQLPHL